MAACINGNGVMSEQTDPGPKIARAGSGVGFNWGILHKRPQSQRSARGDSNRKLLIMVRGSIHQRVKLIMNNHQATRDQAAGLLLHLALDIFYTSDGAESQGVSNSFSP